MYLLYNHSFNCESTDKILLEASNSIAIHLEIQNYVNVYRNDVIEGTICTEDFPIILLMSLGGIDCA